MEKELTLITEDSIKNKIYTIRSVQVMLDSDLAKLYQVETKNLIKAVKRNIERFPINFYFQLESKEFENLRFQSGTSNKRGGRRYLPYVFTEQGVAMLAWVLHSNTAVRTSIAIINAFVEMRHFLSENALVFQRLDKIDIKILEHDKSIGQVLKQLECPREKKAILFFKGQLFDAFVCIADIIGSASKNVILIDNYVDTGTLNLLSKKNTGVTAEVYTSNKGCCLTDNTQSCQTRM